MKANKLNVLLALTDHLAGVFKKGIDEYIKFFKGAQGAFKGEKKTYTPKPGTMDEPNERGFKRVITTVREKLDYLVSSSEEYIDALFAQEKTNSSGLAKAQLVVDGEDFGELSSLELLRLKSLLETGSLKEMYENLPVRNDDEIWTPTTAEDYTDREIFESASRSGVKKTTVKESFILPDPNIDKVDGAKYVPQLSSKDTVMELGDYTHQRFSGEFSHRQRANILKRRSRLLAAVIAALKVANDVEAVPSTVTAARIFGYLHKEE